MKTVNLKSRRVLYISLFVAIINVGCGSSGSSMNIDHCTVLANDITEDTNLGDTCYNVVGNINVPSDTLLTINPGTELFFQEGTQLRINGAMKAIGTPAILEDNGSIRVSAKPIKFTGVEKINGYWNGIQIYDSNDHRNRLENIIIEYAGANQAALNVDGTSRLDIRNSTIQYSGSDGFAIGSDNIIENFSRVTSKDNDGFAGSIYANSLYALDKSSIFTNNKKGDYIIVKGDTVESDQTWKALTVPTIITGDVHVESGKLLTISAGSTLLFDASTQLKVAGALKAIGTAENPIYFGGKQEIIGYWSGIHMDDASDTRNQLSHVTIEYAGGDNGYNEAALYASGNSYINITDTTIQYSKSHGFVLDSNCILNSFKRVTSTNNEGSAGVIHTNALHAMDSSSDFSGNLESEYLIVKGNSIIESQTWNPLNVPVFIMGSFTIQPEAKLTINAGSELVFDSGVTMHVKGALISKGTPSNPVLFTGMQKEIGYWDGVLLEDSQDTKNKMEYTTIEYAGGGYQNASVYLAGESVLKVTNSSIKDSASYGIYLEYKSARRVDAISLENKNSFQNNISGNVYEEKKRQQTFYSF